MISNQELINKYPPKAIFKGPPSYKSQNGQPAPQSLPSRPPAYAPQPVYAPQPAYVTQTNPYTTPQYIAPQSAYQTPYPPQPAFSAPPQYSLPPQHISPLPPQPIPQHIPPQQHIPQHIPPQQHIPQQIHHIPPHQQNPPPHNITPPSQQVLQHAPLQKIPQQPPAQNTPLQTKIPQQTPLPHVSLHKVPQQEIPPPLPKKIPLRPQPAPQTASPSTPQSHSTSTLQQKPATSTASINVKERPLPVQTNANMPVSLTKGPSSTNVHLNPTSPRSTSGPQTTSTVVVQSKTTTVKTPHSISTSTVSLSKSVVKTESLPNADVFLLEAGVPTKKFESIGVEFIAEGAMTQLIFGDLCINLDSSIPSLQTSESSYVLPHESHMYLIKLASESDHFTQILRESSGFYEPVVETPKELVGETENTKRATAAASSIEKGGTAVSQGMISGASFIGKGIKGASNMYIKKTDQGPAREVTEEERLEIEQRQQRTATFLKGTRMVVGGIGKGAQFVGTGISKTVNKVRGPQEEETTENASKKAAVGVAGATVGAVGSVVSGVAESVKIVSADVRDSAVEVKRHKEGDAAAEMTEKQFNTAGQATVGGFHAVKLAATGTVKVAISVGASAATYDHDWKKLLEGETWKAGWLSSQDETLGPWVSKWFVLRSYSLALYKKKKKDRFEPIIYIPTLKIVRVEKVESSVTKKALSFKIVTKSETHFLSVECSDKEEKHGKKVEEDVNSWVDFISNLARICDGTIV